MNEIQAVCEGLGASFHIRDYKRGFFTEPHGEFVQTCQAALARLGLSKELATYQGVTEASVLSRMGLECLVFGPGQGVGHSHRPNECVKISEIERSVDFYREVLESFCIRS